MKSSVSRWIAAAGIGLGLMAGLQTRALAEAGSSSSGQQINIKEIKEKYLAKGEESELRVVRNRAYTKKNRFDLGLFGGFISTDPFLSVNNYGGYLGYYFSEYFSIGFLGWKTAVRNSSALDQFEAAQHKTVNTNEPKYLMAGLASYSPLYGKLSLLGEAIIYLDMHIMAGMGSTHTESGNDVTPLVGIGEQIYINQTVSLRANYFLTYYKETILEKADAATFGSSRGDRSNFSNVVTLGVDFLL